MQEWSSENWANSFNSAKGLLYGDWYEAIARRKFLPPIEASLDPIPKCTLQCEHCNFGKYLSKKQDIKMRRMPDEHLFNLIKFLGKWGVKAGCLGGGGEPTLHLALPEAIRLTRKVGMQISVATNGTNFSNRLIDAMAEYCRWVGVSVDSATYKTYAVGRRANYFNRVIKNIERLVKKVNQLKTNCDVAYKFLIFSYNQKEIYKACKLAKALGVRDFHARPADLSHQGMKERKRFKYDIELIEKQFKKCHKLEDENFRVFTVVHKFDETFKPRKSFSQCYAAPICIQLCAQGVYFCPDQRLNKFYFLGNHYPNPENILRFWGGKRHRRLVFETGKANCISRCTFGIYNDFCEKLFIDAEQDLMCKNFV
jgi:MoaA/NifB/PqqE/SkfB family radical SAM enzyme